MLAVSDRAVATSGYVRARRAHRRPAAGGRRRPGLRIVTLVGPGLAFTDAYATAVFAMGLDGLGWLASSPDRGLRGATPSPTTTASIWTEGMERYLVREG